MGKTVPNQNTIIIKKTPVKSNFLQIDNNEWMQAARDCQKSFNAFKLYLYLASNEVGYEKALSQVAVENALGIKRSSYYDTIDLLKALGYLVDIGSNKLEFYSAKQELKLPQSAGMEKSAAADESPLESTAADKNKITESALAENSVRMDSNAETWANWF